MSRKNMDLDSVGDKPAPQGGYAELPHPQSGELVSSPLLKPDPRGLEWLIPGVGSPLPSPPPCFSHLCRRNSTRGFWLELGLAPFPTHTLTEPSYKHLKSSGHQHRLLDAPGSPEGARAGRDRGLGSVLLSILSLSTKSLHPGNKGRARQPPPCVSASEPELSSLPRWFLPPVSHFQRQPMFSPSISVLL